MKRTITATEARAIMANDEVDNLPSRIINEAGRAAVADFINSAAAEPERHNLEAWFADAEQAANDAGEGEAIIIEMRGLHTASHNPRTLTLEDECFDWIIND